ncbi:MAG: SIS domain-containing protein [Clostridium sp.]|nr:MAG: SIS domain-containing protein [Clostridium sp.]
MLFIGSELYNRNDKAVLYIFISQSGETADLIKAYIDGMNAILLTNVINSTLARKIKDVCYINAYPELSVASTKAFMATIITGIAIIDEEKIMNINEIKRAVLNQLKEATKIKETAAQIFKV